MRDAILAALKDAQDSQDTYRISTLRLISAAVKDRDKANKAEGKDPVSDEEISLILGKMIKQRRESADAYEQSGRIDLAEQERRESAVILEFLPKQLCEEEVHQACQSVVQETGAEGLRDVGKCMSTLKERFAGQMDFGKASGVVKTILRQ